MNGTNTDCHSLLSGTSSSRQPSVGTYRARGRQLLGQKSSRCRRPSPPSTISTLCVSYLGERLLELHVAHPRSEAALHKNGARTTMSRYPRAALVAQLGLQGTSSIATAFSSKGTSKSMELGLLDTAGEKVNKNPPHAADFSVKQ